MRPAAFLMRSLFWSREKRAIGGAPESRISAGLSEESGAAENAVVVAPERWPSGEKLRDIVDVGETYVIIELPMYPEALGGGGFQGSRAIAKICARSASRSSTQCEPNTSVTLLKSNPAVAP